MPATTGAISQGVALNHMEDDMSGNYGRGGGASYASREKQMAAYDSLPRSAREELANGYECWAAYPLAYRWNRGQYKDATALVATIKRWNKERAEKDPATLEKYLNRRQEVGPARNPRGRFMRSKKKVED